MQVEEKHDRLLNHLFASNVKLDQHQTSTTSKIFPRSWRSQKRYSWPFVSLKKKEEKRRGASFDLCVWKSSNCRNNTDVTGRSMRDGSEQDSDYKTEGGQLRQRREGYWGRSGRDTNGSVRRPRLSKQIVQPPSSGQDPSNVAGGHGSAVFQPPRTDLVPCLWRGKWWLNATQAIRLVLDLVVFV